MSFVLFCGPFFLLPYLLPQLMRTRKAFIVYLVISVGIATYLTYDILKLDPAERFDGPGGIFGLIVAYSLAYGAGFGIIVRLLGFLFAYKKVQKKFYWAILILTPVLLIGIIYFLGFYEDWKRRPPSEQCSYDKVNLSLGKTLIDVPTLSIIGASLDDGNQPVNKIDILNFLSNESLRRYCAKTNNGQYRLPVNAVSVNFSGVDAEKYHNEKFKNFCGRGNYFFCKKERYFGTVPYIEDLALYFNGHYDANRMYGSAGETLIEELRANASGNSYSKHNFMKIENLRDYNGDAVVFRCRDTSVNLFCQTNITFSPDVRLITGYVVSHENTKSDLRKLHKDASEFLDTMKLDEVGDGRTH